MFLLMSLTDATNDFNAIKYFYSSPCISPELDLLLQGINDPGNEGLQLAKQNMFEIFTHFYIFLATIVCQNS